MEENKIVNVGDVANEQMVENKKNDAKQKYNDAIGASGDSWADELMADDVRKQPKTASVKSGNTASGDDWADQMMTDDVRRTQQGNTPPQNVPQNVPQGVPQGQPTPKEIEAAHQSAMEAQYQQVPALKALDEETDPVQSLRMAQRMMQGDYADLEMANQQGGGASSASAPRGANYTQAPRFSDNLDTWKYTKTITTYDEGHPLAQAARHANDYGNQLSAGEKAQVYANKSWDDLNRQSQELMRRHPVKEKNSQQFEHDAQLLAAIHNQMVALEYNFSDQNDMYKNIGQKNLRMYLEPMRNSGNPYVAQYEEMFRQGRNFRDFNPFVYDLPDAVLNQREKDISSGEKKPDNYYLHMALRDKDFSNRYHAWSYFGSIQDNMSWGKYKNLGAQVNDLRDERFKEERAKAFAETPGYTITAGLLDSFIGKTVATICNAYDIIAGNPLRTESLNDTLKRSMKYASGGSNAVRGIVSFVPDAVTLMPVTGTGAVKAVGALSKLFEITPKAAKFLVAGGSFMGYEIANTIAGAWAEGEAPNLAEVIGNGCKGLLLGTAGSAVNAGVTGILPKATGRAANYAVRAVGDVAEVGVFVSAEMGMAVASGEHPDFQASLLNNGALIISMKVGHAIAGKGFGIRRDISKSAIEKARALGYDTLADEMVRHNSGRFRNVESAGYSAEALKQLQQIQQNMGKHNVNWREYADMLKPTGASMTRPGVNSVEMVEEDGGYRIVNLDINGVEIDRSKNVMPKDKAEKEVVSRQKKIDFKKERANVEAFDNMRDGHIHATAARRVADQINAEMGAQAVNEDGTPNPDYDGITAQDVLSSFSAIGKKHPATRTPEEQRLMDLFLQEFEDIRMSSPDSNMIKETICEQYGVSKEDFDAAWSKEPGKRGKGAVAQACAAFNTAMSRSYSNVGGDPIIGKVTLSDGRVIEDSVLTRVEVGEDRKPVNPDQKIYYLDENGNTQVISASEVVAMDLQADLGAQADKIAVENRQRKMEQQQQVIAERLADVQSSVLETHLVELQKQIEGGGDADGRLSVAYNSIAKELDRRYQAEYDGLTQAEKAQRFAESKFPDATPEERADIAQHYTEHPQEFETALHYDSIHNGELKALIDTMELRNPVEWMKKFNEYKGDESAFREAYKKKFGVEPTERPYGFKEEAAKEKAAESAEEEFDAEAEPVEGEDIVEEETVTDGTELPEVEGEEESDVSADTQEQTGRLVIDDSKYNENDIMTREELQATADFLNGEMDVREFAHRIGWSDEYLSIFPNEEWKNNARTIAEGRREFLKVEEPKKEETPPVVQAGTKPEDAVAGVKEEVKKEDTQEPKQEQKKEEPSKTDPIDELLDRQGITEDVARQKMRETYEQNPDYFEEEYEREFGKKPEVAKKEEVKEEASKSGMPMKEVDGKMKPDFEKATPEQTIDYLLNEKGYSREQVAKMVEKEVAKKVAAVEEKEKAVADAIARQEEADQAQPETELDFDNMDAYDAEVEKIKADKAAASEAVEKANKELGDALRERAKWEKTAETLSEREKKEDATPKEEPRKPEEKKEEPKKPEEKKEDSKEEPPAKEQPKEEKETPKEEEKKLEPPKEEKNPEEENKSKFDKTAVKERVAKFKTDTPEEREAFSKSVPKMSDEELLAYMEADGKGEYAKAEHPEVYDEYDKRHKDEYLDEYNKEMQSLLDAETSLVSAKAMRSEIDSSDPNLATARRASFRAKRDALDNYIEDPSQKAWKKANKYKPKQDYDLDEKAPDESRPKDHGIQEEDKEEWQKIAEKVNDEGIVNHINKVAKKLKMPIRMYDGAKGDDGYTQNGVIYVNRNNGNPEKTIAFVIGHEVTHGLQQKAQRIGSDAYDRYREAACDYKRLAIGDEAYEELVNEKMDTYKKRLSRDAYERARLAGATIEEALYASDRAAATVTREYIEDEIASDVTGDFVQNPDKYMDWFREARNMSQARRILEGIRDWFATHFSTVYKKNSKLAEARDKFNALYNEVIETEQLKTFEEKTVTSMTDMASSEKRHSYGTEPDVMKKLRNWLRSSEAKKLGWTPEKADNVLRETETLINTLDKALQGDKNYDEWRLRQPTIRVDWRDGEEHPVVTWSRGNIEYKYDMSADLLCINNEGLEEVLSAPAMVDILINGLKETDITNDYKGNFGRKDYARLYQTLKDLGITVPCPGCFDFATRLDMLPSSAKKFTDAVNKVIDERNKDPEAFDNKLRERAKAKGKALANGLPASAKNTQEAIEVAVAGDNATKHIHWHDMLTADGQTGMLADYGGIFRAWQRLGSAKPKDKLLPEPWIGEMTNTGITTIIAPYGKKTPSFREMEVNQGTGLRRNSHSEFRMTLIIDEIQMLREAFMKNLTVFKYMKELDDVRLFGKLGVKYNMSFFPAFDPKGTAAGLGPNGEYIAAEESVGGREFPYIGEDGKTHYDGMKGRDEAMKHCNENVSLSSIAFSVPHLIKLFTDVPTPKDKSGWVGSIIGFHKTNGTAEQLAAQGLGRVRAIEAGRDKGHLFEDEAMSDWDKGVANFEQVQNDRFGEGWVAIKNGKEKPVSYGHKMEFVGAKVYYNKRTGYYLFPEGYAHESELPGGKFTESVRNNPPHPFVVDYNDKVRELNSDYGYKDAADFYVQELSKLGMIPRFEFTVPEKVFLDACKAAGVDPRHPKLGWKGEGNDWHVVDSDAYYSLWCDYGMTDPATGKWSPHRPVGFINEKGEREFRLPDNAVEIAQEGMRRYTERREKESAMVNDAIREFAKRSVEQGRMDAKQANKILKAHGINPEGDGGKRMSLSGRKSRAEEIAEEYAKDGRVSGAESGDRRYSLSTEIEEKYPNWMDNQVIEDENSKKGQRTQVAGTLGTYKKVGGWIEKNLGKNVSVLDASSGMGLGTQELRNNGYNIEDIEPYPSGARMKDNPPTYSGVDAYAKAKADGKKYDYIISNAVLNVIPDDWRNNVLHDMADLLNVGGKMFINTRKTSEVKNVKNKIELESPNEILVGTPENITSYQRFFTPKELKEYVERELGNGYTVEVANMKNSGTNGLAAVVVTKTAEDLSSGIRYSLSPEAQRKQQESTNFKNWFGDWENDPEHASKVVDENGRPLIVYHGTPKGGFTVFDSSKADKTFSGSPYSKFSFFTSSPMVADGYRTGGRGIWGVADAQREELFANDESARGEKMEIKKGYLRATKEQRLDPKTPMRYINRSLAATIKASNNPNQHFEGIPDKYIITEWAIRNPQGLNVGGKSYESQEAAQKAIKKIENKESYYSKDEQRYAVYLDIKNPLVVDMEGGLWNEVFGKVHSLHPEMTRSVYDDTNGRYNYFLDNLGDYDGVIVKNVFDSANVLHEEMSDVYITGDPTQIKSATENNGDFSRSNPDIRYSISYHGSGAEFDKFDHSHMGEGEGAQAYGWGTYVTSVKGIGKTYATESAKKNPTYYWKGQKIDRASINPLSMAYDVVEREGTIKKAISLVDRFLDNPDAHENWAEVKEILKQSKKSDFTIKPARYLYEVDIPDNDGTNYISWTEPLTEEQADRIVQAIYNKYHEKWTIPHDLKRMKEYLLEDGAEGYQFMKRSLENDLGGDKEVSELLHEAGFVGIEYPAQHMSGGRKDGSKNYVIFNADDAKIVDRTRFSLTQGEYADKLSELLARRRNGENVTDELRQLNEKWRNEAQQAAEQFSGTEATEQQNRAVRRAEQEAQRQENKDAEREGRMPIQFVKADLPTTGYEDPQSAIGMAQAAQVRAVLRGEGSRETRRTAVRQLTATMRDLHKAMRAQRDYDRATVGEVVNLVKTYGDLGLLDDATAGEVKKLLTAIKDSTGAEDLHDATTRVLDVVLGAQSRNIKDTIKTLLSTQAAKIGAKGVVEGKMDILGQTAMKELNDWMGRSLVGCNSRLNELSALRAAAEAKVASASGEAEKARAENELAKVKIRQTAAEMAKNYADRLEATEENIRQIENELEQLKQDYKDKIVKGKEYREQKHLLENMLRENRIDQLQTLWDSVNDVHTAVAEGLERGKMFAERQQEHADEIRHDANKDLEGESSRTQDRPGALAKVANNVVVKGASASLYTLDTMLRTLGHKAINGEGFLYERFGRGWLECRDNEITGFWANRDAIDAKAEELFGPKIVAGVKLKRKFSDLIAKARGMKKINVRYFDGGEMRDHEFDQAQALYVYMVNKMDDGAIKLRRMGISEEDVNAIKAQLDDRFVKLADWLQGDFLKRKHAEYNEVHERMFGAPMANIENYVPLRIDQRKRSQEVDISKQLGEEKLSSTTGGIIERVHNTSPLDLLNTNAIDLVLDHLQEMNHWQHFAEWNRDVNTLLSDTTFRNKVMNSKTIYGSGKQLWDRLNQVFQLAGGVYRPKGGDFDTAVVRIAQGVSAAKVSFRVFTAAKQLLSLPVFATECDPHLLLKNVGELFSPVKSGKGENSFKWCMENLPSFKERWKGRMAGDTRLESTELDWNFTKKNIVQWASKFGLTPNAFIDACTVAAGAKSVYETKRGRYIKQGYSEEQADKLAKQDATVAFNQSQQSSEKMFVAPMQVDRTGLAVGASLFRNASMGYERKMVSGVKDTAKFAKGAFNGWKKERAFLERLYQERGLTDTQAKRAAWSTVIRHGIKSLLNIAMYSVGAQAAWNIGGKLPYLIFGDNGDEKRKILKEELIHAALGGWLEGLPFGDNVSNGINNYYCGNKWNTFDPALLPLQADIMKIIQKFDKDFAGGEKTVSETWSAITDVIGLGIQSGIGVNPETFTSILASIVDWGWGRNQTKVDFGPAKEALFFALRFVNTPNTQLDQMYIDEIGMTGAEARKFTPEEIAKRYAFYKTHGSTITAWHLYSREQQDKIVAKYEDAFMKKIGAKDETVDDYIAHAESLNSQNARNTQYNKAYKEIQKNGTAADAWKYYQQELEKFKATGIKQHATCATKWHDIYQEMAGLVPPGEEKEKEDQNVMVSVKDLEKEQKVALLFDAEENSKYLGFTKTIARYTGSSDGGESKLVNELRKLGGSISKKQGGWYFTGENANKAEKMYQQHKEEADRCALATFDKKRVDELINAMNDRRNDYMSDDAMRQIMELCDYWENKMLEDQKKKEKK